tara:strand:+ start:2309 stop:3802 length:1494 start_codon:yes stop_codon:yes gene_type:complete
MANINFNQVNQPISWQGQTDKTHLMYLLGQERELFTDVIDEIMHINYADTYKNWLAQFPTKTIENPDGIYEWYLKGINIRNYPLVAAYADMNLQLLSADPGYGFSTFVLEFDVRMFENTDLIVGSRPEIYQYRVVSEPVQNGSTNWLYEVQLMGADPTLTAPLSTELAAGSRFTKLFSPAPNKLSVQGGNVQHDGYFKMINRINTIRKEYTAAGYMIDAKMNQARQFKFKDANGGLHSYWLDMLNIDYMKEWEIEKAFTMIYSKWNLQTNGTVAQTGVGGNTINQGMGFYEQVAPSNVFQNTFWDLDFIVDKLLLLSYNKIKQADRKFKLYTGELGFTRMHSFIDQTAAAFSNNNAGDRVSGSNTSLKVSGQFKGYGWLQGIEFELEAMPFQDDTRIPSPVFPGSFIPSRSNEILIMSMGTSAEGVPNIQKVMPKNNPESHVYLNGMRSPFTVPGQSPMNPVQAVSGIDGWEVKSMAQLGMQINDPTRVARIVNNII